MPAPAAKKLAHSASSGATSASSTQAFFWRARRDGGTGALVVLADGRYAFTGDVLGMGTRVAVQDAARRQLRLAADEADRGWWRQVIGALAAPET